MTNFYIPARLVAFLRAEARPQIRLVASHACWLQPRGSLGPRGVIHESGGDQALPRRPNQRRVTRREARSVSESF